MLLDSVCVPPAIVTVPAPAMMLPGPWVKSDSIESTAPAAILMVEALVAGAVTLTSALMPAVIVPLFVNAASACRAAPKVTAMAPALVNVDSSLSVAPWPTLMLPLLVLVAGAARRSVAPGGIAIADALLELLMNEPPPAAPATRDVAPA